jgi:hypothetical protein
MNLAIIQVDTQSQCMAFLSFRENFHQQTIYNMDKEVFDAEMLPGGITSTM